ncbi:MAG: lytic transglycosylase domain-containing protein [Acidimicrobiia bacterium]|nr:lytic transglycosylase domain-containing protein [Acidimicrobiia bacterium]
MILGRHLIATGLLVAGIAAGCAADRPTIQQAAAQAPEPTATPATDPAPTPTPEPTPSPTPTPGPSFGEPAPNGRRAPAVPDDPAEVAALLTAAELTIRGEPTMGLDVADAGHLQQLVYRRWSARLDWDELILPTLPEAIRPAAELHLTARRAFREMPTTTGPATELPRWEIIAPASAEDLLAFYQEAAAETGIGWEYLAAINLVETGIGRIDGLSSAGAQGPMQFIDTTWSEIGEGDVNDPRDAIRAAARLLDQRGGPENMAQALFGYNNSDFYVTAVEAYATILRDEPATFAGFYNWEIYFFTERGDVWLPVGTRFDESTPVDDYIDSSPWAQP